MSSSARAGRPHRVAATLPGQRCTDLGAPASVPSLTVGRAGRGSPMGTRLSPWRGGVGGVRPWMVAGLGLGWAEETWQHAGQTGGRWPAGAESLLSWLPPWSPGRGGHDGAGDDVPATGGRAEDVGVGRYRHQAVAGLAVRGPRADSAVEIGDVEPTARSVSPARGIS